jgi:hypothetical protein
VNIGSTTFTLAAPTAAGQVINYLIEASLLENDTAATVLPYYNAANPAQPFSGPGNDGAPQATQRQQTVQLALKPGPAVAIGSQSVAAVDAGWVGLYVISVVYGQTTITAASITTMATAPFLNWKMPQLTPGTRNLAVFKPTNQGNWAVPSGVSVLKLRIWGGGGAGGSGFGGAGGGGAGGGYSEGFYGVTAGQVFSVVVGNGGIGPTAAGETSSFGTLASATGGTAGASGAAGAGGTGALIPGAGAGSGLTMQGGTGGSAINLGSAWLGGAGGCAFGSGGALAIAGSVSVPIAGLNGGGPGSGGSGGIGAGLGGQGGPGLVLVEW